MRVRDIRKGDIITYRSGRVNHVNKPGNYQKYYNVYFKNSELGTNYDIVRIQRYVKFLWFYKLKTIYKRSI